MVFLLARLGHSHHAIVLFVKLEHKTAKPMETIVAGIIFALMVFWIFQDASKG